MQGHINQEAGETQLAPDVDEAARFLTALDPEAKIFTFQTFDDEQDRKDPKLVRVLHGTLRQQAETLASLNAKGAGIFVTVNETDGKGRKTGNIVRVRAVFVDLDGSPLGPVTACEPKPHVITETSPGKWHCYWRAKDVPLDQFTVVQKALIERFGGDASVHDLPRVMRLPGFVHRKGIPFLTHVVSVDGRPPCKMADFPGDKPLPPELLAALDADAGAGIVREEPSEWRKLNDVALQNLSAWVPALLPAAEVSSNGGYRVASKALGRKLQEDISITPQGIVDFGVHDMGDARQGKRTPINLVVEHGHRTAREAADWLRERLGVSGNSKKEETKKEQPDDRIHWHGERVALDERWLIKGCLPETGVAMLSGQWGVYKTFTALDLCGSVMMGEDFAGRKCKRQGGVMFVAAEGANTIPIRLAALVKGRWGSADKLPFAWVDSCPPLRTDGPKELIAKAKAIAARLDADFKLPLSLIVVDTLVAAADFENENDAAQGQRVMNVLRELSRATGALVLAVDHYGKDIDTGTRGTSAKEGSADAILSLLGKRTASGHITNPRMVVRKIRNGPTGIETALEVVPIPLDTDEDGDPITSLTLRWGKPGQSATPESSKRESDEMMDEAIANAGGVPVAQKKVWQAFKEIYAKRGKGESESAARMAFKRALKTGSEEGLYDTDDEGNLVQGSF